MKVVTFTFMIKIDAATFACLMKCFLDFYFAAPRIPPDKRIFTTTHSPNCVFQDVDERFVWTVNALKTPLNVFFKITSYGSCNSIENIVKSLVLSTFLCDT